MPATLVVEKKCESGKSRVEGIRLRPFENPKIPRVHSTMSNLARLAKEKERRKKETWGWGIREGGGGGGGFQYGGEKARKNAT